MKQFTFLVFDDNSESGEKEYTVKGRNFQSAISRLLNIVPDIGEEDILQINAND